MFNPARLAIGCLPHELTAVMHATQPIIAYNQSDLLFLFLMIILKD